MCVLARINKADEGSSIYLCVHFKALVDLKGKYSLHTEEPRPKGQTGDGKKPFQYHHLFSSVCKCLLLTPHLLNVFVIGQQENSLPFGLSKRSQIIQTRISKPTYNSLLFKLKGIVQVFWTWVVWATSVDGGQKPGPVLTGSKAVNVPRSELILHT